MWLEREGAGPPYPFSKLEKRALILGKNAMIVVIYGLNFSFKMKFYGGLHEEKLEIFPCGSFFLVLYIIDYQSTPIPRKLSYLKILPPVDIFINHIQVHKKSFVCLLLSSSKYSPTIQMYFFKI